VPAKEPLGGTPSTSTSGPLPEPKTNPSDVCLLPKTLGPCEGYQGSISQNSISAETFSDEFSSSNLGQKSTLNNRYKFIIV
jgi:hypothetical protein